MPIEPFDSAQGKLLAVRQGERAAFTLIELLVVIAIIAVLASMLVPVAAKSIERSRQVMCSSNLRQVYVGGVSYAGDNKGRFPEYSRGGNRMDATGQSSRWLRVGGEGEEWQNHGKLYADGYVTGGDIYYCPSQKLEDFQYKSYQPWPTSRSWGGGFGVRSAFHYNPMVVDYRRGNFDRLYPTDVALADATTKTPFGVDVMQPGFVSHQQAKGFAGFNILYAGGGVAIKAVSPNDKALRYINNSQFYPAILSMIGEL